MIFYAKDNKLYASEVAVDDESFVEISEEEYMDRINCAVNSREKGAPATDVSDIY